MTRDKVKLLLMLFVFFSAFLEIVHSSNQVIVEFLYWDPSTHPDYCSVCSAWKKLYERFWTKNETLRSIQREYGSAISVEWIEWNSSEGRDKADAYNITSPNSVMINGEVRIEGEFGEQYLKTIIDGYLIHDVAVLSVVTASSSVCVRDTLDINVTVRNKGNYAESFNVTAYYDSSVIGTWYVDSLEPSVETTLVFHWDTQEITEGNYTISASADTLPQEIETNDNVRNGSVVEVRTSYTPTIRHDVAVISVIPSQSIVIMGEKMNFTVRVGNKGTEIESFDVHMFYGESLVDTLPIVNLGLDEEKILSFVWDTANVAADSYSISALAGPVVDETFVADNSYVYGKVEVASRVSPSNAMAVFALAFSFGFFETFSPCLLALLSFILSYTVGEVTRHREGFLQVLFFGIGFVVAAVSVGLTLGLMFLFEQTYHRILTWVVCALAILFGLNLLGLFRSISPETKPLVQSLSKKYAFTYGGLLLLGFLFYFLDPCIAPVFVAMLPLLTHEYLPLIIVVFSLGVVLPFILVGVFVTSISTLARGTYRHKSKIRAVSGLILIAYAVYLIIFYLL